VIIFILCLAAFFAGFVDAIVGGGGLIQLPVLMACLPNLSVPFLLGTNKFSSIFGTSLAIVRYKKKKVHIPWRIILPCAVIAFFMSWIGAQFISRLPSSSIKPAIVFILIAVTLFTFLNKNFGAKNKHLKINISIAIKTLLGASVIGFYDGFLGLGTGGCLIFLFIGTLGLDFLNSSASAKWVNWATNLSAVLYFWKTNSIVFQYAIPMALCNMVGSYAGTHMAVKKGVPFVRFLFLIVISIIFLKLSYDILYAQ
jgi:uncharacterized membrane protein YfcA